MAQSEFVSYLLELLQHCGDVRARRMFGGYGLYSEGVMFALIAADTLYFKVDTTTAQEFDRLGLESFSYRNKHGRVSVMSYRAAPADALDEADALCHWMRLGLQAARRAALESRRRVRR